jgi:phosphocarrier protein
MKCLTLTILNRLGMHARASAKFVSLASEFKSQVTVTRGGREVNGKSIMGIMMLAAGKGAQIELCAEGADQEQAVEALSALINNLFGEED